MHEMSLISRTRPTGPRPRYSREILHIKIESITNGSPLTVVRRISGMELLGNRFKHSMCIFHRHLNSRKIFIFFTSSDVVGDSNTEFWWYSFHVARTWAYTYTGFKVGITYLFFHIIINQEVYFFRVYIHNFYQLKFNITEGLY